ncbi:MarR family transcriptional regulator [Gordonia amarae]|uniref:MarR family transcriptional regulator n=2 Tax=Gordonia amarae TaxID=36821 RepID=A0A857KJX3_9ACTN|nr:MarR family transcriptional regulator [Gordonia amarae]MCS3879047.1 DNA-binding MarR family transcriptional regulator [Gordonia amarae]QHN17586.1 MarR family transcriptional regulator [Gordonia amarae]QHN22112.1 MarR family transcriptional regulator [Gordonia amarae]QHN30993.1 MarR family transcriptional regulator [Gordonia amarae]QHN39739.1 MarR family transcriptional regulator [Gordonia amarae]
MGQRKTPTRDELRIWRGYIETSEALRSRLASRLQDESSLSSGDYQVLLALSEATGRTLRSSELAELIGWERSRLSHHLGRMEKRGLLRRARCPDDPHGIDVALTDDGYSAFREGSIPHLMAIRELFIDALSPEELTQIENLTRTLRQHLNLPPAD